ncbi:hypothetical protein BGM09_07995 [Streptomyces sp. CBMA29]|nr:hypothetical protein [Streptomyces sp. CBMA29]
MAVLGDMGRIVDSRAHVMRLLQRAGFEADGSAVDAAEKDGFDATLRAVGWQIQAQWHRGARS